jgi:dihydrofolate reductase
LIISIIVAIAKNGIIGKANGEMSWHVKEEFQHFKNTTYGYPIVMGRKTFETLGKPLKGRLNIIVTKNPSYQTNFEDVVIKHSLSDALKFGAQINPEKLFIIGGGEIYKQAIQLVDEMIITYMKFDAEGEIRFPHFDENDWLKTKINDHELFEIYRYERKKN